MPKPPVLVLVILDGWGLSSYQRGNAIASAQLPTFEVLFSRYSWVPLAAGGARVGLPEGQMGNSEVGHLNIGAGRVIYPDSTRIDDSIESEEFFENQKIIPILAKARSKALHLLGLVSDAGVHSHIRHLAALLRFAKKQRVERVFIHGFTDGRDTHPKNAVKHLKQVTEAARRIGVGKIASLGGRYYAMDRDRRWERTERAYRAIVEGTPHRVFKDAFEGIDASYQEGVSDEFIAPFSLTDDRGTPVGRLGQEDAVIFFNFRADRARQLTRALTAEDFDHFDRPQGPVRDFLTMTQYDRTFDLPIAFSPRRLDRILVNLFADHNLPNLRLAETEKYAHVTYFFNGGEEELYPGEKRLLIPSPKIATYDLQPEMSAFSITDRLLHELDCGSYQAIAVNFANADMVGHTGVMEATIKAVEVVDTCVGQIHEKVSALGGLMMVTSDHGNAEQMIDPKNGDIHTAHTTNPVPFILVDNHYRGKLRSGGALEDIAPTVLDYLEIEKPPEMTGHSLLEVD